MKEFPAIVEGSQGDTNEKATFFLLSLLLLTTVVTAQEAFRRRLEQSPRHQEWVAVPSGDRAVQSFLVFPEVQEKVPAVIAKSQIPSPCSGE